MPAVRGMCKQREGNQEAKELNKRFGGRPSAIPIKVDKENQRTTKLIRGQASISPQQLLTKTQRKD